MAEILIKQKKYSEAIKIYENLSRIIQKKRFTLQKKKKIKK